MTRERAAKPAVRRSTVFEPWAPPVDVRAFDIASLQALANGCATDQQQKNALRFILKDLCEVDEVTFIPGGEDGRRATDFAEGKRRVGTLIRTYLAADPRRYKDESSTQGSSRPPIDPPTA